MKFEIDLSNEELDALYLIVKRAHLAIECGLDWPRPENVAVIKVLIAAGYLKEKT